MPAGVSYTWRGEGDRRSKHRQQRRARCLWGCALTGPTLQWVQAILQPQSARCGRGQGESNSVACAQRIVRRARCRAAAVAPAPSTRAAAASARHVVAGAMGSCLSASGLQVPLPAVEQRLVLVRPPAEDCWEMLGSGLDAKCCVTSASTNRPLPAFLSSMPGCRAASRPTRSPCGNTARMQEGH